MDQVSNPPPSSSSPPPSGASPVSPSPATPPSPPGGRVPGSAAGFGAGSASTAPDVAPPREGELPRSPAGLPMLPIEVKGEKFLMELALDEPSRQRGLGGHRSLAPDRGMLFAHPKPEILGYWMKGCFIDIDIVYVDAMGKITGASSDEEGAAAEARREPLRLPTTAAVLLEPPLRRARARVPRPARLIGSTSAWASSSISRSRSSARCRPSSGSLPRAEAGETIAVHHARRSRSTGHALDESPTRGPRASGPPDAHRLANRSMRARRPRSTKHTLNLSPIRGPRASGPPCERSNAARESEHPIRPDSCGRVELHSSRASPQDAQPVRHAPDSSLRNRSPRRGSHDARLDQSSQAARVSLVCRG